MIKGKEKCYGMSARKLRNCSRKEYLMRQLQYFQDTIILFIRFQTKFRFTQLNSPK